MSWIMAGGAAVSVVGGLLGKKSAKKAAQAQQRMQEEMARKQLEAKQQSYNRQLGIAEQERAASANPLFAGADTGFANARYNPETGQMESQLNAPWAAQRDMFMDNSRTASGQGNRMFDMANKFYDQAGDFNPQTFATERYNAAQALLGEQDARSQEGLMADLFNRGGFGLRVNQAAAATPLAGGGVAAGQGTVGVNPLVDTFMNARNRRNAEMSYRSLGEGQSYLDAILGRGNNALNLGTGMFNLAGNQNQSAMGIQDTTTGAMNAASNWTNFLNAQRDAQNARYFNALRGAEGFRTTGDVSYFNQLAQGNAAIGANNRAQLFPMLGSSIGGAMTGGLGAKLGGLFGGQIGSAAGGGMPAGTAYNTGMFPGYPGGDMN